MKKKNNRINNKLKDFLKNKELEVGVDEVGRGCLFGRVYAAAVMWNSYDDCSYFKVCDSKKLNKRDLIHSSGCIKTHAIDYGIGYETPRYIETNNILNSSIHSMHKSLDKLVVPVENIIVDGNKFKTWTNDEGTNIQYDCIIKGDSKFKSIAAASIIAKVARDKYIYDIVEQFPELNKYEIAKNKGYGTPAHINALQKYGTTPFHRKTYKIVKDIEFENEYFNKIDQDIINNWL